MLPDTPPDAPAVLALIDAIYRQHRPRIFATLIRLLGSFERAEEAVHEAFRAAVEQWPLVGVPQNPLPWLVSSGRFRVIDSLRRERRFMAIDDVSELIDTLASDQPGPGEVELLEDDRLRLIFTCCHPALAAEAQVALTLREVCGLSTEEIARACLLPTPTLAQRIVRAKAKIRTARIPYQVPDLEQLPQRLDAVLRVIYLVFNEGYSASSGPELTRQELSQEAIRLARLLLQLLPQPEVAGLLALMLLHEARRASRSSTTGELVPLDEQERSHWDAAMIAEGSHLVAQVLRGGRFGAYTLQAAIAAVHAGAPLARDTDWDQIVGLYDVLLQHAPSLVIELNRAVAIAMRDGPTVGLALVDALLQTGELDHYYLAHAARADLCRRLQRVDEARSAYLRALQLTQQEPERRFLQRRLQELQS